MTNKDNLDRGEAKNPFTSLYPKANGGMPVDSNLVKLRALQEFLGLPSSQLAKFGGVSPTYLTRVFNGTLKGSGSFYSRIEASLPEIIRVRRKQVFQLEISTVDAAIVLRDAG